MITKWLFTLYNYCTTQKYPDLWPPILICSICWLPVWIYFSAVNKPKDQGDKDFRDQIQIQKPVRRWVLFTQNLKGFRTFKTFFLWWMYNSCCTIRKAAVLTLCKTLCKLMTNCCGLHCYHPFTLHGTQSITNRKWQRRSPEARANWPVDLDKLLLDHDETFCVTQKGNLGLFRKKLIFKVLNPFKLLPLFVLFNCTVVVIFYHTPVDQPRSIPLQNLLRDSFQVLELYFTN